MLKKLKAFFGRKVINIHVTRMARGVEVNIGKCVEWGNTNAGCRCGGD
jgi:hypothetical protein